MSAAQGINELKKGIDACEDGEIFRKEIGGIIASVKLERDECPDFSYYGEFTNFVQYPEILCYHRRSKLGWDGRNWRDEKGRIREEPEGIHSTSYREYQFIDASSCSIEKGSKNWWKYAMENAARLDRLDDDWIYCDIVAEVFFSGVEIGSACVSGFEFDLFNDAKNAEYYASDVQEILLEALQDAKETLMKKKEEFQKVKVRAS